MAQRKRTRSGGQDEEEQARTKKAQKVPESDEESGNEGDDEGSTSPEHSSDEGSTSPSHSSDEGSESPGHSSDAPDVIMFEDEPAPGSPSSTSNESEQEEDRLTKANTEKFLAAWTARMQELFDTYPTNAIERRKLALARESDERTLARIGWILEKLKPTRVCVAVLLTANNKLFTYANAIDDDLETDLEKIQQIAKDLGDSSSPKLAKASQQTYEGLLATLKKAAVSELRTGKTPANIEKKEAKANRRFTKVLNFFRKHPSITFQIHNARTDNKHAEMRAADAATEGGTGSVGISKLCCGKCALALQALEQEKEVSFLVLGAHFKTYDTSTGWPVPNFLKKNDDAMKIFLGKEAFAIYKKSPSACLELIKTTKLSSSAYRDTDHYSSEEDESADWLADDEEEEESD